MAEITGSQNDDTLPGTADDDIIRLGRGADVANGAAGDDVFFLQSGIGQGTGIRDTIEGGVGTDTVFINGNFADFDILENLNQDFILITGAGISEELRNVEVVQFNDATVRIVDADDGEGAYTTIQSAVDASDAGDTIIVKADVYNENVKVTTDALTIRSADNTARQNVVVAPLSYDADKEGISEGETIDAVFSAERLNDFRLESLTITGGLGFTDNREVGVFLQNADEAVLEDVIVRATDTGVLAESLLSGFTDLRVNRSRIDNFDNQAILTDNVRLEILNNLIVGNGLSETLQNGFEFFESVGTVFNNTITELGFDSNADTVASFGILAFGTDEVGQLAINSNTITAAAGGGDFGGINVNGINGDVIDPVRILNNTITADGTDFSFGIIAGDVSDFQVDFNEITGTGEPLSIVGFNDLGFGRALDNIFSSIDLGVLFESDPTNQNPYNLDGSNGDDLIILADFTSAEATLGNAGFDTVFGFGGDDFIEAFNGRDSIVGGGGDDTIFGGLGIDTIFGGARDDDIFGGAAGDSLEGGSGDDFIDGGGGADIITGGAGRDTLFGSAGDDTFIFNSTSDTGTTVPTADIIDLFRFGDVVDLSAIDAALGQPGNQSFTFIEAEGAGFTAAGQVRYNITASGDAVVSLNTDGNTATREAAIFIELDGSGLSELTADSFIL